MSSGERVLVIDPAFASFARRKVNQWHSGPEAYAHQDEISNPYPRSGYIREKLTERDQARRNLFEVVYMGPNFDTYSLTSEENDEMLESRSDLAVVAAYEGLVQFAVKTLGAEPVDREHLRKIFGDGADEIIAQGVPRDWDGDPIIAQMLFGITDQQAQITALFYGLQDGFSRSSQEMAAMLGIEATLVEAEITETIKKLITR